MAAVLAGPPRFAVRGRRPVFARSEMEPSLSSEAGGPRASDLALVLINILRQPRAITVILVPRCAEAFGGAVTFGSMNVQSLSSTKLDVFLEVHCKHRLGVMLLCETWHDPDSVSISRLHADGFTVVKLARLLSLTSSHQSCMTF